MNRPMSARSDLLLVGEGTGSGRPDPDRHVEVDGGTVLRVEGADPGGHLGPPVTTLGAVAPVAEAGHEFDERLGDASHVPTRGAGRLGEPVAGSDGTTTWNGVLRPTAERRRIGEARDHVEELDDRTRPTVGEQQWQGVLVGRPRRG